jgi:hypothetical protein
LAANLSALDGFARTCHGGGVALYVRTPAVLRT